LYYVLMALLAAVGAGIAYCRTQHKAALVAAYFLSMAGVMVADWVAWGMLRLYEYHPSLSASPLVDAVWGELLGDILFVPGTTVALLALGSLAATAVLGTILFTVMEQLFIGAGLFTLTGWPVWATPAAFPLYFWVVWRYHRAAVTTGVQGRWVGLVLRGALLFCTSATIALWLRAAQGTTVNIHVMPTQMQNQSLGRFLLYVLLPAVVGQWVMAGPRHSRLLAATLGFVLANYALRALGLQSFTPPWNEVVDALSQGLGVGVACVLEYWILRLEQTERGPAFIR